MIIPVILVGGSGSRLWPLSRELYPKQFLKLQGSLTMLQETVKRIHGLDALEPLLICNEEHRFIVKEQLTQNDLPYSDIILEPAGRNTAPAIALAALRAQHFDKDPVLLVLAADHVITDVQAFHTALKQAQPYAEAGKLVTFGIKPSHPETGYGYIKVQKSDEPGYCIDAFIEKPNLVQAQAYLESGDYYWNSGMFMFRASTFLAELKQFQPTIYNHCVQAIKGMSNKHQYLYVDKESFLNCPADSIDYAVMEHTEKAVVVPLDAGWSDIGSWAALWSNFAKDKEGNVTQGDVINLDSKDCYIRSDEKLAVAIGLENVVVINTKDAVLVAAKDKVQDVKKVVALLNEAERSEAKIHREVYRPWGKYDSIDQGPRYQVKRITVNPGEKLSIQMHHHRAEHWIVVSGTAKVTNGDKTYLLGENQSTYIPLGVVHALENPGKVPLEIIEVQSGSYLGEDDIVRFEDRYGRSSIAKQSEEVEIA